MYLCVIFLFFNFICFVADAPKYEIVIWKLLKFFEYYQLERLLTVIVFRVVNLPLYLSSLRMILEVF
jgi:hypothetical protein